MSLKERSAITGIGETAYSKQLRQERGGAPDGGRARGHRRCRAVADGHRRHHRLHGERRGGGGLRHQLRHSGPPLLGDHAHGRRQRGRRRAVRDGGDRGRRLPSRPDPARPQRGLGQPHRHPRPRDAAVPRRRRVRDAGGGDRAGAALRADGPPSHGALRDHQSPVRRDRRGDPPARGAPRQRHHDRADDASRTIRPRG